MITIQSLALLGRYLNKITYLLRHNAKNPHDYSSNHIQWLLKSDFHARLIQSEQGVQVKPWLGFVNFTLLLLVRTCEDKESVSHYRRCGALTALLINKSPFSPPLWHRGSHLINHYLLHRNNNVPWLDNTDFNEHGGSAWMYGELVEELGQRGGEVLTPFMLFLQR